MPTALTTANPKIRHRRVKIADEIIESLRQDIVMRRLLDGERLPSEKELSDRFGVSQPTIREAIRALETLGLVEVLHGSGTFVRSQGDFALAFALQTLLQLQSVGIMEVLDIRHVLGRYSINLAAANATKDDIARIEQACARYEKIDEVKDADEMIGLIIGFQTAVSAASRSPLMRSLEAFMLALLNTVQVNSVSSRGPLGWRAKAMEFHQFRIDILEGIRSGDPVIACAAINRYFDAEIRVFEQDGNLRDLNLSSPDLINMISKVVHEFKS